MSSIAPEKPAQPRELPPGVWEPPPVRRGSESQEQAVHPVEETAVDEAPPPPVTKRLAKFIPAMILATVVLLGVGLWFVLNHWQKSEANLSKQAFAFYKQGSFKPAREIFEELRKNFPNSDQAKKYEFMVEWCGVCSSASDLDADLPEVATQFDEFIKNYKKDPLMVDLSHDAGQRMIQLAKTLSARSANPTDATLLPAADRIEQLRRAVITLGPNALTPGESRQIDVDLGKVRRAVELTRLRRDTLADIRVRDKETPMDAIKRARSLLARMEREERELAGISQEAKPALDQLEKLHLESIVYQAAKDAPASRSQPPGEEADVLLFAPRLRASKDASSPDDPIVLGLVRGVLYALNASNGELKWAYHVGPDTTVLPQRVPASAITPELLLVLSADTQTLSALKLDGDSLWEYHVGQPVLGRPVIIEQRAYLADYSGWVHEIELSRGQLLGRWFLRQPLTCGGAREEGTSRIYFPADDSCIYVLDVNPNVRRCVSILYDGHPFGSLRSEPVIVPPEGDSAPGYLILNQASGLDTTQLRVFELPLQDPHALPLTLSSQARLAGWTWFEPKEDGEKLAVLSDAGILGLFGIRQLGNNDPALFPLLRSGELDLSPLLRQSPSPTKRRELSRERGRSLVVNMQGNDLWVLAHGRFQQLHLRLNPSLGPQAVPIWKAPLELGSPLHEPQLIKERNGQTSFFLVTQALDQQTCLATKVDEEGQILWQRQLGSVCQGEPLALTPPGGGPPLLVMLDQGGGLFELNPQLPAKNLRSGRTALAPALAENPHFMPRLLPAAEGCSAYEIAIPGDGQSLLVRHIEWSGAGRKLQFSACAAPLPPSGAGVMTPAGPPVVTRSLLLIPMSDGQIRGMSLTDGQPTLQTGPKWRQAQSSALAPSILALGGDRFLISDGNRQLSVWEWPPAKNSVWEALPKEGDGEPLKPLEFLMTAPPALLPGAKDQTRVVVADSAGFLRLFTVTPVGVLQAGRTWPLQGNLTGGPFVQATPEGWRIGCILNRRRLLWIDPTKEEPLWRYSTDGPTIVGRPQRIDDLLIIALQSGRYVGIDPKTGEPRGTGYTLRTSAAPAATPMPFGPGRMFAPLSDGTALLLSAEILKRN